VLDFSSKRIKSSTPVAVVTGGSSGIGAEIVRELSHDHLVIAIGRDMDRLEEVVESVASTAPEISAAGRSATAGGSESRVIPVFADLADPESAGEILLEEVTPLGRVDVLVHCAAMAPRFTVEDAMPDDWRESFATNVIAPAEITRSLLPLLRMVKGTVVFIGSGASRTSVPFHTVYSASKHALQALADGLRQQVGEDGVRVSTVAPGPTHTRMAQESGQHDYPVEEREFRLDPTSVARSVRHVVDAPEDALVSEVWVRPRQ
jgi:NAD(P)-dependent dehydrogenase (short-subunit alcohol dehydrogenase family)